MSVHGIIQDGLITQMGYGNYMGTVPSHLYSYYAQLIAQLQYGMIFNETNQHQTGLWIFWVDKVSISSISRLKPREPLNLVRSDELFGKKKKNFCLKW